MAKLASIQLPKELLEQIYAEVEARVERKFRSEIAELNRKINSLQGLKMSKIVGGIGIYAGALGFHFGGGAMISGDAGGIVAVAFGVFLFICGTRCFSDATVPAVPDALMLVACAGG